MGYFDDAFGGNEGGTAQPEDAGADANASRGRGRGRGGGGGGGGGGEGRRKRSREHDGNDDPFGFEGRGGARRRRRYAAEEAEAEEADDLEEGEEGENNAPQGVNIGSGVVIPGTLLYVGLKRQAERMVRVSRMIEDDYGDPRFDVMTEDCPFCMFNHILDRTEHTASMAQVFAMYWKNRSRSCIFQLSREVASFYEETVGVPRRRKCPDKQTPKLTASIVYFHFQKHCNDTLSLLEREIENLIDIIDALQEENLVIRSSVADCQIIDKKSADLRLKYSKELRSCLAQRDRAIEDLLKSYQAMAAKEEARTAHPTVIECVNNLFLTQTFE